jgi:hypothetical protein
MSKLVVTKIKRLLGKLTDPEELKSIESQVCARRGRIHLNAINAAWKLFSKLRTGDYVLMKKSTVWVLHRVSHMQPRKKLLWVNGIAAPYTPRHLYNNGTILAPGSPLARQALYSRMGITVDEEAR